MLQHEPPTWPMLPADSCADLLPDSELFRHDSPRRSTLGSESGSDLQHLESSGVVLAAADAVGAVTLPAIHLSKPELTMSTVRAASSTPMRKPDNEPKPIDLGYERPDYGVPVPSDPEDGDERATVTEYPTLNLNDIKLPAGTPETGEARITYRIRRVDTGGEGASDKPSVTLEIKDICFCGDADWPEEDEKKSPMGVAAMLAKAVSER